MEYNREMYPVNSRSKGWDIPSILLFSLCLFVLLIISLSFVGEVVETYTEIFVFAAFGLFSLFFLAFLVFNLIGLVYAIFSLGQEETGLGRTDNHRYLENGEFIFLYINPLGDENSSTLWIWNEPEW